VAVFIIDYIRVILFFVLARKKLSKLMNPVQFINWCQGIIVLIVGMAEDTVGVTLS
jgi:hypothetical protein